jgi:hypothetical protein
VSPWSPYIRRSKTDETSKLLKDIVTDYFQIFRAQLGKLATRLDQEQNVELVFVDGTIETECHEQMIGMFQGPYYSWFPTPSENMVVNYESAKPSLDFVQEIIEEDGPFDGIMGFSEGAGLALALLLRHSIDHPLDPSYAIFKFAIFFSCVGSNDVRVQWDSKLNIPSLHILDKMDSLLATGTSTAACEPGSSRVIFHNRGHFIPRDSATINEMIVAIQELQHRARVT